MTIEMNDNSSIALTISILVLAIACSAMFGCHQVENTQREAIKAGLVQKQNPGTLTPIWTKE